MRKLIVQEFVSVDGFAAGPNDSVDFVPASNTGDQSLFQRQLDFTDSIDTIVLGRVTYSMFADYWPNVTSGDDKQLAEKINAIPKVVFSKTLRRAPWGSFKDATIVRDDPAAALDRMKREPGQNMVIWGSLSIAQLAMAAGVADEVQLIVCPVVLGSGRSLFGETLTSLTMLTLNVRSFERGSVLLSYGTSRAPTKGKPTGQPPRSKGKKAG